MKSLAGRSFIFMDDEYFIEAKLNTKPTEITIKRNKEYFNIINDETYPDNFIYKLIDTLYLVISEENLKEIKICNITEKSQNFIINRAFFYRQKMLYLSFDWKIEKDFLFGKYNNIFEECNYANI